MARIRSIKPELASKKKLAAVSRDARLTFVLVLSQADDEGYLMAEPRQLLGALYPHDEDVTEARLEAWLAELVGIRSLVFRETHDGARVLQVVGWHEHQRVKNPAKSKITPTLRLSSGDSTEDRGRLSPLEGGRGKEEEGRGKVEGASAPPPPPPSRWRALLDRVVSPDTGVHPAHAAVVVQQLQALAASQEVRATALAAELEAIEQGLHGPAASLAQIAAALHELVVAGEALRPQLIRAYVRRVREGAAGGAPDAVAGGTSGHGAGPVRVGAQILAAADFWRLCVSGGLAAPMQSRAMVEEAVQRMHLAGQVQDAELFTELVMHVQPWVLAEIKFGREREERLRAALATWRAPQRVGVAT